MVPPSSSTITTQEDNTLNTNMPPAAIIPTASRGITTLDSFNISTSLLKDTNKLPDIIHQLYSSNASPNNTNNNNNNTYTPRNATIIRTHTLSFTKKSVTKVTADLDSVWSIVIVPHFIHSN